MALVDASGAYLPFPSTDTLCLIAFALSPQDTRTAIAVRGAVSPLFFPTPAPTTTAFALEAKQLVAGLGSEPVVSSLQAVYSDVLDAAGWQQLRGSLQALTPSSVKGAAHGLKWQTQQANQATAGLPAVGLGQAGSFGLAGFGPSLGGLTAGVPQLSWGGAEPQAAAMAATMAPRSSIQRQREEEADDGDDWTKALSSDSN